MRIIILLLIAFQVNAEQTRSIDLTMQEIEFPVPPKDAKGFNFSQNK